MRIPGLTIEKAAVAAHNMIGQVERAHRTLQSLARTWIRTVKTKYEMDIGHGDDLCWLWRHVVWLYNRVHVDDEGKTAFDRLTGRTNSWGYPIFGFGSPIVVSVSKTGKLEPQWARGMYLGVIGVEHLVMTEEGVVRSMGVKNLEERADVIRVFPKYRSLTDQDGKDRTTDRIFTQGCKGCLDRRYRHTVQCTKRNFASVTSTVKGLDDPMTSEELTSSSKEATDTNQQEKQAEPETAKPAGQEEQEEQSEKATGSGEQERAWDKQPGGKGSGEQDRAWQDKGGAPGPRTTAIPSTHPPPCPMTPVKIPPGASEDDDLFDSPQGGPVGGTGVKRPSSVEPEPKRLRVEACVLSDKHSRNSGPGDS